MVGGGEKGGERRNGSPVGKGRRERESQKDKEGEEECCCLQSRICSQKLYSLFNAFSPFIFSPIKIIP